MSEKNFNKIKLFALSNMLVERELDKFEKEFSVELGRENSTDSEKDDHYYPQFQQSLRSEAARMAKHYELFYCLETSIRSLISETLASSHGSNWWEICVPEDVKKNVNDNIQREVDSGVTQRSELELDYTTFGELSKIVEKNWQGFDAIFSSSKAFSKIMTNLNNLRGPIAHCCPLADDEVLRLQLAVKDWFRLME